VGEPVAVIKYVGNAVSTLPEAVVGLVITGASGSTATGGVEVGEGVRVGVNEGVGVFVGTGEVVGVGE